MPLVKPTGWEMPAGVYAQTVLRHLGSHITPTATLAHCLPHLFQLSRAARQPLSGRRLFLLPADIAWTPHAHTQALHNQRFRAHLPLRDNYLPATTLTCTASSGAGQTHCTVSHVLPCLPPAPPTFTYIPPLPYLFSQHLLLLTPQHIPTPPRSVTRTAFG